MPSTSTMSRRLSRFECASILAGAHGALTLRYRDGALAAIRRDARLSRQFTATEEEIDRLADLPEGPEERVFRAAVDAHCAVWREGVNATKQTEFF